MCNLLLDARPDRRGWRVTYHRIHRGYLAGTQLAAVAVASLKLPVPLSRPRFVTGPSANAIRPRTSPPTTHTQASLGDGAAVLLGTRSQDGSSANFVAAFGSQVGSVIRHYVSGLQARKAAGSLLPPRNLSPPPLPAPTLALLMPLCRRWPQAFRQASWLVPWPRSAAVAAAASRASPKPEGRTPPSLRRPWSWPGRAWVCCCS